MAKPLTPVRGDDENHPLVARWYLVHFSGRNPETVSRNCHPVACDVKNRSLLYDLTESLRILAGLRSK